MKKLVLVFLLTLSFDFFAQQSIIQEQSNYYKSFHFTKDAQWDSLNAIENGVSSGVGNENSLRTTTACNLNKKVYGWHPYWSGSTYNNYDWSMLSDFCYFDYSVSPTTGNNTNASFDWATNAAVTAAKSNSVNIHFCATLFASHSTFWASASAQQTFITNAINLLNTRGGNGLNIDFEVMGASDKVPFKNFMINLCNQVHAANPNYRVSMALYAVEWSSVFDIPALNAVVDDFIVMGYDYYYSSSPQAGPCAPLYNFQTSYNYNLSKSITYYLKQGVPNSKLLLGLPYYGREWETASSTIPSSTTGAFTSSRTYAYVRNNAGTYSTTNKRWDNNSFNPCYVYTSSGNSRQCWIDDAYSMGRKFDMVNQRGLAGIGIWALGYDDGYQDFWLAIKNKFSDCSTYSCTDSIYDMGGPNRNYYDNESYTYTLTSGSADKLRLNFTQMDLQAGNDSLSIFDGPNTSSPLLAVCSGSINPGVINSTNPSVTIKFKSDGTSNRGGYKALWNCISASANPATQITSPSGWVTQNFVANYVDTDVPSGSGINQRFYQTSYFNGTEWRSNSSNGFFNDDFDESVIHSDWVNAGGTWNTNSTNALNQTDETNANTNLYAMVTQSLATTYLYNFRAAITGTTTNRRAGIYIASDNPSQTQRGNSYLIYFRPDQSAIEFYRSTANVIGSPTHTLSCTINASTMYDYKISYDATNGQINVWVNDTYIGSWTDSSPITNGTGISFRTGNCKFMVDNIKVYRLRSTSSSISVGSGNANDLRNENVSPGISSGKINSLAKSNTNKLSPINTLLLDIDWTKPFKPTIIKDGTASDIDTTGVATQLDLNYTAAKDTNSGIANYYYAIGSTAGSTDIIAWTANGTSLSKTQTGLSLVSTQKYYIMVKALNGAGLMSDSVVSDGVVYLTGYVGVKETTTLNSLSVYPNPATSKATISIIGSENETVYYSLFDMQGKLIEQQPINTSSGITTLQIDVNQLQLSKAVYFIKLSLHNQEVTKKLIVE